MRRRDLLRGTAAAHQVPYTAKLMELINTGKRMPRYVQIFTAFRRRFDLGEMHQVTYL